MNPSLVPPFPPGNGRFFVGFAENDIDRPGHPNECSVEARKSHNARREGAPGISHHRSGGWDDRPSHLHKPADAVDQAHLFDRVGFDVEELGGLLARATL